MIEIEYTESREVDGKKVSYAVSCKAKDLSDLEIERIGGCLRDIMAMAKHGPSKPEEAKP